MSVKYGNTVNMSYRDYVKVGVCSSIKGGYKALDTTTHKTFTML